MRRYLICFLSGIAFLWLLESRVSAVTFTIPDGDVGALRSAITTANTNNVDDTINLATNGGYYIVDVNNTTNGANGLPVIDRDAGSGTGHSLTINGNGATIARSFASGAPYFRIFYISNGVFANQHTTTISNVTLTNGLIPGSNPGDGDGGAIYVSQGQLTLNNCVLTANLAGQRGGAIFVGGNTANLTLNNCTLSNNTGHVTGGAIQNFGPVVALNNCTLSGNSTVTGPGGAIWNTANGGNTQTITLTNCTLSGNAASINSDGDAIFNSTVTTSFTSAARITVSNCTFDGNDIVNSYFYTGGVQSHATVTLSNSLFNNSPLTNNANAGTTTTTITSNGYNLSNDNGGGFLNNTGDQININPKLDPAGLKNNGGSTQTIALLNGSPALDKGKNFGVTTDQRGQSRPFDLAAVGNASGGDGSDIGAYESHDPIQNGVVFTVNTTADHDDGVCGTLDCTLREAIAAANATVGANTINVSLSGTITLSLGQLVVSEATTINGPGARLLAVSGNNTTRVFNFGGGPSVLFGLTIRNGFVTNAALFQASGGGLSNFGTLTVNDCYFTNNQATGGAGNNDGSGGGSALGGAIYNLFGGGLTLNRCTFASNAASGGPGGANSGSGTFGGNGGNAQGGGIFNDSGCTLTLQNCTFSANQANGGAGGNDPSFGGGIGGAGQGAAIYNRGTMTSTSCTISVNSGVGGAGGTGNSPINNGAAGTGSGGLTHGGGTSTVRNTLSAGNSGVAGPDADGSFTSQGYNLIGIADFSSGFTAPGDQVGTTAAPLNAKLGPLQNNGGPTNTIALLSTSPALDQGKGFGLTTDQRSRGRPFDSSIPNATGGDGSDIGAFESGGGLAPFTAVSRKFHGTSTPSPFFDIPLPLSGSIGTECRRNTGADAGFTPNSGRDHEVIITFASTITALGSIVVQDNNNGNIPITFSVSGNIVTVDLHSVPATPQRLSINLNGVSDGTETVNVSVPMGVLAGDTTADGTTNSGDIAQTKSKSGQTVDASNFRSDVTVDGTLNSGDIGLVKSKSGTALP